MTPSNVDGHDERRLRAAHAIFVAATGVLSVPFFPAVPGRDDFGGEQCHTGLWPAAGVDLAGKRVAVVGTGSSGVQIVPVIADEVAALTVYQRSANWCTPLNNAPITAAEQAQLRADFVSICETLNTSPAGFLHPMHDRRTFDDSPEERRAFYEQMWERPGFGKLISHYTDMMIDPAANAEWCEFVAAKIRSLVDDPGHRRSADSEGSRVRREAPAVRDELLRGVQQAERRAGRSLTETPMVRVTAAGIETADGVREFDVIIWATGFDFGTGALVAHGHPRTRRPALDDHWADGPRTFLGIQTAGFPNFFFPGGPHAAAGNNPRYNGDQVDFVEGLLEFARDDGAEVVEVTAEAEERWTAMIDRNAQRAGSFGESSYYFGTNVPGKPKQVPVERGRTPEVSRRRRAAEVANGYPSFRLSRTGVSGEPTTPGRRSGGAVSRKRLRLCRGATPRARAGTTARRAARRA